MNSLFVILSSLLAVAMCQGDQRCCLPEKFTANEAIMFAEVVDGKPRIIMGSIDMSMDGTIQMVNFQMSYIVDSKQITLRVLDDYNNKTKYLIKNGKCTISPLDEWKPHCFTDYTFMANRYFGSSTASLDASIYQLVAITNTVYSTVTREKSCVPIGASRSDQSRGDLLLESVVFSNVTRSIPDPSVFDVPAICRTAPKIDRTAPEIDQASIFGGSYLFR